VPHNLDTVVLRALAKEPDERYANASDLLRDLDSVLYSYTPAPGSADVAIYLHRLQAEEAAVAEAKAREAAQAVPQDEPAARRRKSKAAPVSRRTGAAPKVAPPAAPPHPPSKPPSTPSSASARTPGSAAAGPEVFGSLASRAAEAEKGRRTRLYVGIGAAAVALAGFVAWKMTRPQPTRPVVAVATPPPAAVSTPVPQITTVPTPALDPQAVEAEVQRQLAAKRKELEKVAAPSKKVRAGEEAAAAVAVEETAPEPTSPPPTELPTLAPTARPEPTAIPTEIPEPPRAPATQRGDLVGPGPGVVEPVLISAPRVVYPPMARELRVGGRVVVLVQVDENGQVIESRLQQGVAGQTAINEAVVAALRNAKFQSGTKNGIPVKMWRPVVVEVKP
jgi:TonB family protein